MKAYNTLSDTELIQLYNQGNSNAFACIVKRYESRIFTSIFLLVKDRYLAEDIFQDVFIRVLESIKNSAYTEEGKFLPYVMRIAHNLCMDHFRKSKRLPTIKTSDNLDIFDVLNFAEPAREDKIIQGEMQERVRRLLDKLPEDQREVIILRHFADLSFKEISALTNSSINTALGRMRYGLKNIRKMTIERQIAI